MPFINKLYFRFNKLLARNFPRLHQYLTTRKSIVKFIIAGSFSSGTDLVVLFLMYDLLKMEIVFSTSVAFIMSFVISFTLQKFWTFRNKSQERLTRQFFLYMLTAFFGLNINAAGMHMLVNGFNIWYILAQVIVNLFLGFINFIIYKFIIFRKRKHEIDNEENFIGRA